MNRHRLYSIGHSNHTQEEFLELLTKHDVNCIVDVRSVPASKFTPQFNSEPLKCFLKRHNIPYLYFGDEFGARRTDCLDENDQVNFEKAIDTPNFMRGVNRLMKGLEGGFHISLMCSEANPLECHRFSLISRYFYDKGMDVQHILKDGCIVSHAVLEKEMIDEFLHARKSRLPELDLLFGTYTQEDQRQDAYRLKNKEIGFRPLQELTFASK